MIIEGNGKESLPEISEEMLSNPELDGGVIRECLTPIDIEVLQRANALMKQGAVSEAVMSVMPQFSSTYSLIESYWQSNGYANYRLDDALFFTDYVPAGRGIEPHIDYYNNMEDFLQAGLSFSFSVGEVNSSAIVKVTRPKEMYFKQENGEINISSLLEWQKMIESNQVTWHDVEVSYGDIFILPQHPTPAGHSVIASRLREAFIMDYLAYKNS